MLASLFQACADHPSVAMEVLWPEIQQELKIVESEEELPFAVASPEKGHQQQELKASPPSVSSSETNNVACSSVLPLPSLEDKNVVRSTPTLPYVPLCGDFSKGSKENPVYISKVFRKQEGVSPTLPKLENIPCGLPCSKVCLEKEDRRPGCPSIPQEQKPPSKTQESTALSRDKAWSHPQEKPFDQSEREGKKWLLRGKKGDTVCTSQAEEGYNMCSDTEELASSETFPAAAAQIKEKRMNDKARDSLDQQEEDAWVDHAQSLELVEPWEDHQWVTSPLHSPTLKDTLGKALQEFQPPSQGVTRGHFKKPCFSRSFSLDSKDFVKRHWAVHVPFMSADEDEPLGGDTRSSVRESSQAQWKETDRVRAWLNLSEEPSKQAEASKNAQSFETALAAKEFPSAPPPSEKGSPEEEAYVAKKDQEVSKLEYSFLQSNTGDGVLSTTRPEKASLSVQEADCPGADATKDSALESQGSKSEPTPRKERPRPSSLNLDSVLPSTNLFNFESLSVPNPPRHFLCGQEVKTSDSVPSLPVSCPSKNRTDLWGSHFDPQDVDLDYIMMAHAATGRRNSAPVSVSAVRTSFMIKMCQARAVPVIPPKIQYTQVPQPLQTQNPNCRTQMAPENKEVEVSVGQCRSIPNALGQLQVPKSPSFDRKGKENNNATTLVDLASRKTDPSFSNHGSQDAPVLRRKRTSEGEAIGDNPQSSKIERPSGVSKPSYRSRPGRPQSLILFSPPFPIMDHPSSSADSRVLLSPIKSPSHTSSPGPLAGDMSGTASEGVTLRNKMTIPKNGQRLETSTSCFYQPQRRSVILDGRSGRQIE